MAKITMETLLVPTGINPDIATKDSSGVKDSVIESGSEFLDAVMDAKTSVFLRNAYITENGIWPEKWSLKKVTGLPEGDLNIISESFAYLCEKDGRIIREAAMLGGKKTCDIGSSELYIYDKQFPMSKDCGKYNRDYALRYKDAGLLGLASETEDAVKVVLECLKAFILRFVEYSNAVRTEFYEILRREKSELGEISYDDLSVLRGIEVQTVKFKRGFASRIVHYLGEMLSVTRDFHSLGDDQNAKYLANPVDVTRSADEVQKTLYHTAKDVLTPLYIEDAISELDSADFVFLTDGFMDFLSSFSKTISSSLDDIPEYRFVNPDTDLGLSAKSVYSRVHAAILILEQMLFMRKALSNIIYAGKKPTPNQGENTL